MSHTQRQYGQVGMTTHGVTLSMDSLVSHLITPNFQRQELAGWVVAWWRLTGSFLARMNDKQIQ